MASGAMDAGTTAESAGANCNIQDSKLPDTRSGSGSASPAVRFASAVQTISPDQAGISDIMSPPSPENITTSATPDQIRELSTSLQRTYLQERRMSSFLFEPYSLPPSRVNSSDDRSGQASRQASRSTLGPHSPLPSPKLAEMHPSPPLTPSGSGPAGSTDDVTAKQRPSVQIPVAAHDASAITPQASSSQGAASPLTGPEGLTRPPSDPPSESTPDESDARIPAHRRGMFSLGAQSVPVSRETSPSRPASQYYSRPLTPSGDANDPYAASKRQPQYSHHGNVDARFVFSRKKKTSNSSYTTLASTARNAPGKQEKRQSLLGKKSSGELQQKESSAPTIHSRHGSMADLKRFFKAAVGGGQSKKGTLSTNSSRGKSGASKLAHQIPFADDHGLTTKWGRLGKVLGSGAGGSVRLMKRSEDGTIFAVKEFRPRHSHETEKEYVKKLTAEFCIGSTLHHGNIIETLDIVQEKGKWYEVMEYAPFDLFAIVMTGRMSREEITCCWLQILSGVTYLHSMGLAHRDLKLDNVVVSEHGIMKIIDFGSSHVFQYSFETSTVKASGIVGSDPYLAPEVYDEKKYEAPAVDIWSLAIIFCCMSLRRFPWKIPRLSDNSFKLFAADPTPGHDPEKLILPSRPRYGPHSPSPAGDEDDQNENKHSSSKEATSPTEQKQPGEKKEVIRGPWRLLRLLPRESRHIIGRMLQIDPSKRAAMSEILAEPWVANTVICHQVGPGEVVAATDHTHVLEPPSANK